MDQSRWYHRAACAGADPAIFADMSANARFRWRKARTLCESCPVLQDCLDDALGREDLPTWPRGQVDPIGGRRFAMFQAGHTPDELNLLYLEKESRKAA